MGVYEIKSFGHKEPWIDLQVAAYDELQRNGGADGFIFDPMSHVFTSDSGLKIPSTTTILREEGLTPDYFLVDPYYKDRGRIIHKCTELCDKGDLDEYTVDPEVMPYLDAYITFKLDWHGKITNVEERRYHPVYFYAGIIDRIIEGNKSYILYLKPGKKPPYELKLMENLRGSLNVFLSALNVHTWKTNNMKGEASGD